MTLGFYIKIAIGKFIANIVSGMYRNKEKRHKVREKLHPLNPERCISYLIKHYVNELPIDIYRDNDKETECIWVCWFQGIENAPKIVSNCIQSIRRFNQEWQVILITANNFQNYVDLPHIIINKWKRGIIGNAHFADILRLHLMAHYGGVWVDSTCLMLAPIPKSILCSDFFVFHSHGEFEYTLIQNCFIRCRKNNYIVRKWVAAVNEYWKQENICINYFIPHLIFVALLQTDDRFREEFSKVPVVHDENMHFIMKKMMLGDVYSEDLLNIARNKCFVQKLTYKFSSRLLENQNTIAGVLSK